MNDTITSTQPETMLEKIITSLPENLRKHFSVKVDDVNDCALLQYRDFTVYSLSRIFTVATPEAIDYIASTRVLLTEGLLGSAFKGTVEHEAFKELPELSISESIMDLFFRFRNYDLVEHWHDIRQIFDDRFELVVGCSYGVKGGKIALSLVIQTSDPLEGIYALKIEGPALLRWINYWIMDYGHATPSEYNATAECPYVALAKAALIERHSVGLTVQGEQTYDITFSRNIDISTSDYIRMTVIENKTKNRFQTDGGRGLTNLLIGFLQHCVRENGSALVAPWGYFIAPFTDKRETINFTMTAVNGQLITLQLQ